METGGSGFKQESSPTKEQILGRSLQATFEIYHNAGIDVRLVGSLGRYASLNQPIPSVDAPESRGGE